MAAIKEQADLVRAALAEAGFPHAEVTGGSGREVCVSLGPGPGGVPLEVCWMAFFVCGMAETCWPCWEAGWDAAHCTHDVATAPRPTVPRHG